MIVPQLAAVKPRVVSPDNGDELLLEDVIESLIEQGHKGRICVTGLPGAGKSVALAHLAAQDYADQLTLLDDANLIDVRKLPKDRLVVCAARRPIDATLPMPLVGWKRDDLIDYLLAVHPSQCASVVARFAEDSHVLAGNASLFCRVADEFAADENLADMRAALRAAVARLCESPKRLRVARRYAAAISQRGRDGVRRIRYRNLLRTINDELRTLLGLRIVQILLTADYFHSRILQDGKGIFPNEMLPRDVIRELAQLLRDDSESFEQLQAMFDDRREFRPLVASVLFAARPHWRPSGENCNLKGGFFAEANWQEIKLARAELANVILSNANLRCAELSSAKLFDADLSGADGFRADFSGVIATGANLCNARFRRANLSHGIFNKARMANLDLSDGFALFANFHQANLTSANFSRANLHSSNLVGATLQNADFQSAQLQYAILRDTSLQNVNMHGANLSGADCCRCDLEFVEWPGLQLAGANLTGAYLTGGNLSGADLSGCKLKFCGLADVDLSFADLRESDLRQCTFHMGSSRSGLVGSAPAGHGSKTGFYTNDFDEQHYKPPHVIRKANLCGADLRGARIEDVDFYLVDLRGAKFDAKQEAHFRRCDAILEDR